MTDYFDISDLLPEKGRRERKKRATSHRIFKSAMELMKTHDFDGVSVEEICEKADVARATFFQHFPSKASLFGVASEIVRLRIETELAKSEFHAEDQLRLIVKHFGLLSSELGPVAPKMFSAFASEPGGGFHIDEPESGVSSLIVQIVRKGQEDGHLARDWPPEEVAICLVSSWVGAARYRLSHPRESSKASFADVLELILNGLKPR